jgi:pyridoxine kinase
MKRILSIQSSVTYGFVGNNVATPVLTSMGIHPLAVNSVMLAAHPGYGVIAGHATPANHIAAILDGLVSLGIVPDIDAIISGYLGHTDQVAIIASLISKWRNTGANGAYIADLVLGDADRLYVDQTLADQMIDQLFPLADIITPNQFELAYLSDMPVADSDSAIMAGQHLLASRTGLTAVIATGISNGDDFVHDILITRMTHKSWQYDKRPAGISGSGDLFTSLLAGGLVQGLLLDAATARASNLAQAVIARSHNPKELALLENLDLFKTDS